jgi:hypothetical protein
MQYFNPPPPDPRTFGNPSFPQQKESSSWFGWFIVAIGALVTGFFIGKNSKKITEKIEPLGQELTEKLENKVEDLKECIEQILGMDFEELEPEIIKKYTDNFDKLNRAEKLWCKREFEENPQLQKKYPKLSLKLGIEPNEDFNLL